MNKTVQKPPTPSSIKLGTGFAKEGEYKSFVIQSKNDKYMKRENGIGGTLPDRQINNKELTIDELWKKSKENPTIKKLGAGESLQEIMDLSPDLKKAFECELDEMGCSDEGIEGPKLGTAGNLILASPEEVREFIQRYKERIKRVKSHDGCGAANEKYHLLNKNQDEWNKFKVEYGLERKSVKDMFNNGDELGKWWSKEIIAKGLNADYSHTDEEEMIRGKTHHARALYCDGTSRFNYSAIEEMPVGFTCSGPGFGLSPEYCEKEIRALCGIAFSGHGFDDKKLDEENPFYIFVCAKDQKQLGDLEKIARKAVAKYDKKVEIKGFIHKVDEPDQ